MADIERLIITHRDAIYRQMLRVCGNHDDAEDALATAILSALKASEQLRDPSSFQGWLAMIGRRACARLKGRMKESKFASLEALQALGFEASNGAPGPDEAGELAELQNCVREAIAGVPELYREVYVRREILGEPAAEVAASMDLSVPALKSRLHRARQMVRAALDDGLGCPEASV
ncbi:MAG: sigma-70 family RNA polymerase sigma factor [Fimbriimonadaceae bacterium]|nr:sigma-70 family RNA polymerase sigma factor [Fimbriimonadaceae bacterium]